MDLFKGGHLASAKKRQKYLNKEEKRTDIENIMQQFGIDINFK